MLGKFSRDLVNLFEESVATLWGSKRKMTKTKVPSYLRFGDVLTQRKIRVINYFFGFSDEKVSADLIEKVEGLNSLGQSLGDLNQRYFPKLSV